eukprot:m.48692 g.48692  ORF g.48692 m.48692 type:complete len:173 (+) comp7022_c0_seq1:185-703(+)
MSSYPTVLLHGLLSPYMYHTHACSHINMPDAAEYMKAAMAFYDFSETGKGWDKCKDYVVNEDAPFDGQFVGSLSAIKTIKDYVGFTYGCTIAMPGCTATPWFAGFDEKNRSVNICADFKGHNTQPCEGFPPPTGKSTVSHYSYTVWFNEDCKIIRMRKLWNDQYAMKELGWV